ncbi:MAG TPA: carbohydrate porin [Steroidobacteraceae bacterium]|jgi:high affinity Mn2+ porin|nr:carbohydrate porin [Steroidobacteraceae bacterium]
MSHFDRHRVRLNGSERRILLVLAARAVAAILRTLMLSLPASQLWAVDGPRSVTTQPPGEERFAIHGQLTYVEQESNGFNAPYSGRNSLAPSQGRETVDATLFLGARLWSGAEAWVNPEIDQGFGLSNTLGVAGFPSGEAYKVGANQPYFRLPRAFIRQTVDIGAEREFVAGVANQLQGSRSLDRWVFTAGKFAVTDVFDTFQYAHDPRNDFLNWASVDAGTFDYAADAWGFTVGAAAELYRGSWTFRGGVFQLSNVPNSEVLEHNFDEFQMDAEIEKRYPLFGQTGRVLLTVFDSRGRMGLYDQAIALAEATGTTPNTANVRQYRSRLGANLGLEQPLTDDIGVFTRVGKAQGNVEVYEFADIDRSVAIGTSIKGTAWHRANDVLGAAILDNRISGEFEQYLHLGGLGILVGDGKLPHPGDERIIETYYSVAPLSWARISLDYQWVKNPAYNTQRGPVSILAVRVHVQL